MTDPTLPQGSPQQSEPRRSGPPEGGNARKVIWALVALAAILAGALVFVLVSQNDEDVVAAPDPSTSSAPAPAPAPAGMPDDAELDTVVWPGPDSGIRYTTPDAAAEGFAAGLVGFTDPIIGDFSQGDTASGEIEVRARDDGQPTTVFVRRLSDDNWWVLGAVTEFIELDQPAAGDTIANPAALAGRSTAFEATVNVSVFQLGGTVPIGEGIVMGGSMGDVQPFSGEVAYDPRAAGRGVVVLYTISARDGSIEEAAATPVQLG
jgi:hypothetical protein